MLIFVCLVFFLSGNWEIDLNCRTGTDWLRHRGPGIVLQFYFGVSTEIPRPTVCRLEFSFPRIEKIDSFSGPPGTLCLMTWVDYVSHTCLGLLHVKIVNGSITTLKTIPPGY